MFELAGTSEKSIEDAISNAIAHMDSSQGEVRWFEVVETRGHVEKGKVAHYQVIIKVGCLAE
jgi:flavin-binding protein dodecin